jgi:hypothetical protein
MSAKVEVVSGAVSQKQYVCFVKSRVGAEFVPYMKRDNPDILLVQTIREFLDCELAVWFSAGKKSGVDTAVVSKNTLEQFVRDVQELGMNSRFAGMLGWHYGEAARFVEREGSVLLLTVHPRFFSLPFSFNRVRDDDDYARAFVEKMLSVRGGEIAFEEYDPAKHVAGYRYEP